MSPLRPPTAPPWRRALAALGALAVATLVATGCGVNDNGGVIERPVTTPAPPMPQTGS